jgi:hypothetical protein
MRKKRPTITEMLTGIHRLLQGVNSAVLDINARSIRETNAEHLPDVDFSEVPIADEDNPAYWRGYRARVQEEDRRRLEAEVRH